MVADVEEVAWALSGNVIVGFGAGTATLVAFAPALPVVDGSNPAVRVGLVSVGFALFFAGYRLTQSGTHGDLRPSLAAATPARSTAPGETATARSSRAFLVLRGVFVVLGVVGLGAGMRLFALTIQTWSAPLGLATGVVCILGYIFGHIGMNGVVL